MATWILLLRGINVGGRRRLSMKALANDLESLGLDRVRTYIQSGNAVFRSPLREAERLEAAIAEVLEENHGFRPEVLVIPEPDLQEAIGQNPFPDAAASPRTLHLFFLAGEPEAADLGGLDAACADSERFRLQGRLFYLHAPDGLARSRLAARAEKLLGVPATARNWRTVLKLAEMARDAREA